MIDCAATAAEVMELYVGDVTETAVVAGSGVTVPGIEEDIVVSKEVGVVVSAVAGVH